MLELRPICENCATDLPPDSTAARICSYECTFCRTCVETVLENVCPNCGGGFQPRPIRPAREWQSGVSLASQSAATDRKHSPVNEDDQRALITRLATAAPDKR